MLRYVYLVVRVVNILNSRQTAIGGFPEMKTVKSVCFDFQPNYVATLNIHINIPKWTYRCHVYLTVSPCPSPRVQDPPNQSEESRLSPLPVQCLVIKVFPSPQSTEEKLEKQLEEAKVLETCAVLQCERLYHDVLKEARDKLGPDHALTTKVKLLP